MPTPKTLSDFVYNDLPSVINFRQVIKFISLLEAKTIRSGNYKVIELLLTL